MFDASHQEIVNENAELIHRVVMAVAADEYVPALEKVLADAESNGWTALTAAVRKIVSGERDLLQLDGLDEEDRTIVSAILRGIDNPSLLPDLTHTIDPAVAGVSMAHMIHDAAAGNRAALDAIRAVGRQMSSVRHGDFSQLAPAINLMLEGERREKVVCYGLGTAGSSLVKAILGELQKLDA